MYRSRKTGVIGIIITVVILILLVFLTNVDVTKLSYTENIFNKLVMPIQSGLTVLKHKIAGNNVFFDDMDSLKAENEQLKKEKKKLEESLRELEIIKAENATLREYNNMAEKYKEYKTVPAYIIDKNVQFIYINSIFLCKLIIKSICSIGSFAMLNNNSSPLILLHMYL